MRRIHVFVSFDVEHDEELYAEFLAQSRIPRSIFAVSGGSGSASECAGVWSERVRREIRAADEIIIICGEHTDCSERVGVELRMAQEERRPYMLLWGRRDRMCTKPATARSADGIYSWTTEILRGQMLEMRRAAEAAARAAALRQGKPGSGG
jgi:hypothetical protein